MTTTILWSSRTGDVRANLALINNLEATEAPVATSDASSGYVPGSMWIVGGDAPSAFVCIDASEGEAVWLELGGGGGDAPVQSVNSQTGAVVLDAQDVGAATAAQGALADTAVQPDDLGSAAGQPSTAFATSAQGALADTALQTPTSIPAYSAEPADLAAALVAVGLMQAE